MWGRSPQPPEAGGLEAKPPVAGGRGGLVAEPPALENLRFFAKITKLKGCFDKKIMLLKRGLEIGSANMIKLVA